MAADKISIKVEADTREASANLARFADRARETAESVGRIGAGVAAGLAGIGVAVGGIARATAAFEANERAATLLGDAYDQVRIATLGTVTAQQALRTQQGLVQSGLQVSAQQLGVITRAARDYAHATGTETAEALGTLSDALRGMEAEGLRRFNITVAQSGDRTRDFNAALEQLAQRQATTQTASRTMAEDIDAASNAMGRFTGSIAASIARALELQQAFQWAANLLDPDVQRREMQGSVALARASVRAELRGRAMRAIGEAEQAGLNVTRLRQVMATRGITEDDLSRLTGFAQESARATVRGGASAVALNQGVLEQAITPRMRELMQMAEQERARQAAPAQPAAAARRTGGGGGGTDPSIAAMRGLREAMADAMARGAPRVEIGRPDPRESLADYLGRLTSIQRSLTSQTLTPAQIAEGAAEVARQEEEALKAGTTRSEAIEAMRRGDIDLQQRRFARDRETRRMARAESLGGRALSALGIETDEEGRVRAFDALQTGADLLGQSLGTLRSGFSELFNTLASGSMSAGEAFQQFAAKTLKSLGEMSINQGIALTFQGIAALFTNPVAAPLMLAGGAGLIALGTGLGAAGAAATPAPPSTGGAAPSAARSASGPSPRGDTGGGGNVTIVLSSLVPPGPRELQGLVHAQRQAGRYGLADARMVPRQVRA